ncbi:conserved hypothetical protein [Tenacibaculum maritimum]|uniref:DUF3089 domain-containing protein n=1 Tax=Tenacibaculum maritimum TaxID=107401 RepID=UPI0012E498BC|nr:DUF3089 domain-containing protein [Tenacibaculum maritimum]CAA0261801.1 conserved hypothetical protein [Tenacibaculum maritimum]
MIAITNKYIRIVLLYTIPFIFFNCRSTYQTQPFNTSHIPTRPNYENESTWAVLPNKYNAELKKFSPKDRKLLKADVFYIYPTLLTDKKDKRWNISTSDPIQHKKILNRAVKYQASAFATSGQIYVPIYRQAHVRSYELYDEGGREAFEIAYSDIKKAFETYLKKYNAGRPIIIASHSQGTTHSKRLLKDFFDKKPLQKQLIAAYLVGMGIQPNEYETILPMKTPSETGGFVSWNTYKKGYYPKSNNNWYKGSVTTNPITWDHSKTTKLSQHKGFLYTNDKIYAESLKIEVTDGLIWSTTPKFPLRLFMSFLKNYHTGDINLFWQDIRENAMLRTKAYLEKNIDDN